MNTKSMAVIRRTGTSWAVTLAPGILETAGIQFGDTVIVEADSKRIIIKKA